jgi:hypothetical protein
MQGFIDGRRADSDERSCHSDDYLRDMCVNGHIAFPLSVFGACAGLTTPQLATAHPLVGESPLSDNDMCDILKNEEASLALTTDL